MKKWSWFLSALMLGAACFGAEENDGMGNSERRPERSGMMEAFRKVTDEIKNKYPGEYAELEKLQQSDRRAAMEKMRELAAKAGVEMPSFSGRERGRDRDFSRERRRDSTVNTADSAALELWQKTLAQLKEKFPEEFAEYEKTLVNDPTAALKLLEALAVKAGITLPPQPELTPAVTSLRNENRSMVERANRLLARLNPAEYAELELLRQEDEDAAREYFRSLVREADLSLDELRQNSGRRGSATSLIIYELNGSADLSKSTSQGSSTRRGSSGSSGPAFGGGMPPGDGGAPPPPPGM